MGRQEQVEITSRGDTMTLEQFKERHYGKRGTAKRDELEARYNSFKKDALIHEA